MNQPSSLKKHYPRPELARSIADELTGKIPLSGAPNGLFFAGPRRTGKTDFLRFDLKPEMEQRGYLVLYADLWSDKARSPMELIASCIATALQETLGLVAKLAKRAGLEKAGIPGAFSVDVSKIGKTDGMSLHDAFRLLRKQSGKPVLLMVDEAQHALTSQDGDNSLAALKSARDQMREEGKAGLLIVMSGSHRDKLMRLLNTAATPFWGSQVRALPLLDSGFVALRARELSAAYPHLGTVRQSVLEEAFEHTGRRPEFFDPQLIAAASAADSAGFESALLGAVREYRSNERQELTDTYLRLPPLEQAVLRHLLEQGGEFKPFDARALAFYTKAVDKKISVPQVQRALESLRVDDPPLVWKSLRGDYAVYDQAMASWYAYLVSENNWPPKK